jgi:hypothetical protein
MTSGNKKLWVPSWATFAAVLGVSSALLTITGMHFALPLAIAFVFVALVLATVVNYVGRRGPHLLVDDIIPASITELGQTTLVCPSTTMLADEAKRLALDCYDSDRSISPERYEQFRAKNPHILACLTDVRGKMLGYFDVIPLKDDFARLFVQGRVTEMDITHDDIFAKPEMSACSFVFISGLAVWKPDSAAGCRHASMLVWGLLKYLDHFYGSRSRHVLALAGTPAGGQLLDRFKLTIECDAARRKEGYSLYGSALSRHEINLRLACVPNWTQLCQPSWVDTGAPPDRPRRRPPLPVSKPRRLTPLMSAADTNR